MLVLSSEQNTFCGLPRLLYAYSTPTLRLLGECPEITIAVCVFGGKQSEKVHSYLMRDKDTKSNRIAFLCKENSNTEKRGRGRYFNPWVAGDLKNGPVRLTGMSQ